MARLLVQTTLPHSRQTSKTFVRTNGALKVSVSAHPLLELPYGRYPRLLMAWVTTEAVRTREPVLQLGHSLNSFMSQLGLLLRGGQTGPIGRLREQMQRLFGATIAFTWDKRTAGDWHDSGFRVSNETHLWWNPLRTKQAVSRRSTVTLGPGFFKSVCERPVPIDLQVLVLYPAARVEQVRGGEPPLPESLHEVERFIADNPNHPYRVAEPLRMILK